MSDKELIAEARQCHQARGWSKDPLVDKLENLANRLANALEAATRVPVQGEPNDDREALAELVQRFEESDNPDYLLADFLLSQGVGFSRATVPDAATSDLTVKFDGGRCTMLNSDSRVVGYFPRFAELLAERNAALAVVERVRAAVKPWGWMLSAAKGEVLAALDGAPEPEEKP